MKSVHKTLLLSVVAAIALYPHWKSDLHSLWGVLIIAYTGKRRFIVSAVLALICLYGLPLHYFGFIENNDTFWLMLKPLLFFFLVLELLPLEPFIFSRDALIT